MNHEWSRRTINTVECKHCGKWGPYELQFEKDDCPGKVQPEVAKKRFVTEQVYQKIVETLGSSICKDCAGSGERLSLNDVTLEKGLTTCVFCEGKGLLADGDALRSYLAWQREGRYVRKGQTAVAWANGTALFRRNQTSANGVSGLDITVKQKTTTEPDNTEKLLAGIGGPSWDVPDSDPPDSPWRMSL